MYYGLCVNNTPMHDTLQCLQNIGRITDSVYHWCNTAVNNTCNTAVNNMCNTAVNNTHLAHHNARGQCLQNRTPVTAYAMSG